MSETKGNSYDEMPYESFPIRQSHPNQLGTIAKLVGMTPKPLNQCRVLELGCAAGGNLIPQALAYPNSQFVGVDLSGRQIRDGLEAVQRLGLNNIELKHASILEVDDSYGEFDYIICHGVFSWVPADVQEKIIEVSCRNLAPNGVAYISYNTYPGWHMRGMVRNIMRYHSALFTDPQMKVRQARAILDFLAKSVPAENSPYGMRLRQELEWLQKKADHYLYHEHLEEVNEPEYFHEFVARAEKHGLQYLGEAIYNQSAMAAVGLPPNVEQTLRRVTSDLIRMEQYLDFVRNRTFRQTLLCHKETRLDRQVTPQLLRDFYVCCAAQPTSKIARYASAEQTEFANPEGTKLSTQSPALKAAIACLGEVWPKCLTMTELWERTTARLQAERDSGAHVPADAFATLDELAVRMFKCYISNFAQLLMEAPPFTTEINEAPTAFSLARLQAESQPRVTNLKHEVIPVREFHREILKRLDGRHDREAMLDELVDLKLRGEFFVDRPDEMAGDRATASALIHQRLDQTLRHFAVNALLVG